MAMSAEVSMLPAKRALVVDDEETVGQIMCHVLQQMGYQVDHVLDGQQALDVARGQHYNAVVCDLLMPGVNGMALFETWLVEDPDLARKVIFVTGDSLGTDTSEFVTRSGCPCIYKPFRLAQLAELVESMDAVV
jgi:CheY-like chemotaxis protein